MVLMQAYLTTEMVNLFTIFAYGVSSNTNQVWRIINMSAFMAVVWCSITYGSQLFSLEQRNMFALVELYVIAIALSILLLISIFVTVKLRNSRVVGWWSMSICGIDVPFFTIIVVLVVMISIVFATLYQRMFKPQVQLQTGLTASVNALLNNCIWILSLIFLALGVYGEKDRTVATAFVTDLVLMRKALRTLAFDMMDISEHDAYKYGSAAEPRYRSTLQSGPPPADLPHLSDPDTSLASSSSTDVVISEALEALDSMQGRSDMRAYEARFATMMATMREMSEVIKQQKAVNERLVMEKESADAKRESKVEVGTDIVLGVAPTPPISPRSTVSSVSESTLVDFKSVGNTKRFVVARNELYTIGVYNFSLYGYLTLFQNHISPIPIKPCLEERLVHMFSRNSVDIHALPDHKEPRKYIGMAGITTREVDGSVELQVSPGQWALMLGNPLHSAKAGENWTSIIADRNANILRSVTISKYEAWNKENNVKHYWPDWVIRVKCREHNDCDAHEHNSSAVCYRCHVGPSQVCQSCYWIVNCGDVLCIARHLPTAPRALLGGVFTRLRDLTANRLNLVINHVKANPMPTVAAVATVVSAAAAIKMASSRQPRRSLADLEAKKRRPSKQTKKRREKELGKVFDFYGHTARAKADGDGYYVLIEHDNGFVDSIHMDQSTWDYYNEQGAIDHVYDVYGDGIYDGDDYIRDNEEAMDYALAGIDDADFGNVAKFRTMMSKDYGSVRVIKPMASAIPRIEYKMLEVKMPTKQLWTNTSPTLEAHTGSVSVPVKVFNSVLMLDSFVGTKGIATGMAFIHMGYMITATHNVVDINNNMEFVDKIIWRDVSGVHTGIIMGPTIKAQHKIFGKDIICIPVKGNVPPSLDLAPPILGSVVMACAMKVPKTNTLSHFSWGNIARMGVEQYPDEYGGGNVDVMYHTCDTDSGSSGSPLVAVTADGSVRVVGVHTGRTADRKSAFAIRVTQDMLDWFNNRKLASNPKPAVIATVAPKAKVEARATAYNKEVKLCPIPGCGFNSRVPHGTQPCNTTNCKRSVCHFTHKNKVESKFVTTCKVIGCDADSAIVAVCSNHCEVDHKSRVDELICVGTHQTHHPNANGRQVTTPRGL